MARADDIDHGWPSVPHDERPYLQSHGGPLSHRQLSEMSHGAPVQMVRLADLTATQESVGSDEVERYVEDPERKLKKGVVNPKNGMLIDMPLVVLWRDEAYIHDGHHRLFAARTQGDEEAPARVVDADAAAFAKWAERRGDAQGEEEAE